MFMARRGLPDINFGLFWKTEWLAYHIFKVKLGHHVKKRLCISLIIGPGNLDMKTIFMVSF